MTQQLTISSRKRLLDEGSFQELLAAAYVLQQHNELPSNASASLRQVVAEIVRIQRLIRDGHSNLLQTAQLISRQVQKFTRAEGVAIGIVTDDELIYLAAVGTASQDVGRRVPRDTSLPSHCIRTGVTFRSPRTPDDPRMLVSLRVLDEVRSLIAVPVEYEKKVVGILEARFKTLDAFTDDDVLTCELIAALVKEVITQAGRHHVTQDIEPQNEPEQQSASAQESIDIGETEALPPHLRDENSAPPSTVSVAEPQLLAPLRILPESEVEEVDTEPSIKPSAAVAADGACRGCGQHLSELELFCGKCGTERIINPAGPLQSKWASLWFMNQARKSAEDQEDQVLQESPTLRSEELPENGLPDLAEQPIDDIAESLSTIDDLTYEAPAQSAQPSVRLEWLPEIALSARETWLHRQWRLNRANFYLGAAAVLLILVLSGLGTTPALDSHLATGPQLTLFERILVGLGIAEAPQTPAYAGNPDTPVWVDLHTALYYCPGSDLYGKTDGGKIATQRSAQMDQFEPAHRKACN